MNRPNNLKEGELCPVCHTTDCIDHPHIEISDNGVWSTTSTEIMKTCKMRKYFIGWKAMEERLGWPTNKEGQNLTAEEILKLTEAYERKIQQTGREFSEAAFGTWFELEPKTTKE